MHNMGVPVTSVLGTVFRGADVESQLNVHARRAAESAPTTSLADINKKVRVAKHCSEEPQIWQPAQVRRGVRRKTCACDSCLKSFY